MRTAYISFDGKIFDDERACQKYENKVKENIIMYGSNGLTNDYGEAIFLHIQNTDGIAKIKDLSRQENLGEYPDETKDINDTGYYLWDYYNCTYKRLPYIEAIEAIGKFYNERVLTEKI